MGTNSYRSFLKVSCMQLTAAKPLPLLLLFVLFMRCTAFRGSSLRILHLVTSCGSETFGTTLSSSFLHRYCQKGSFSVSRRTFSSSSNSREVKSNMAAFEPSTNTHIVENLNLVQAKVDQVCAP